MRRIKIIDVPNRDEPLEIRQGWLGCVIDLDENFLQPAPAVAGEIYIHADHKPIYTVTLANALAALKQKNLAASAWYSSQDPKSFTDDGKIHFDVDVCKLIDDEPE
ncbi:MAG: hypothetical protein WCO23_05335 [bacterium]